MQADLQAGKAGLQQEWERAQAAAAERAEAAVRLEAARSAALAAAEDFRGKSDVFAAAVAKLRQPEVEELERPLEYWVSAQCRAPLGQSCKPLRPLDIKELHCHSNTLWLCCSWVKRRLVLPKIAAIIGCQRKKFGIHKVTDLQR